MKGWLKIEGEMVYQSYPIECDVVLFLTVMKPHLKPNSTNKIFTFLNDSSSTKSAFTCSKLIETLEQGVKYVQN